MASNRRLFGCCVRGVFASYARRHKICDCRIQALIQINIDSEPQKAGVAPDQLDALANQIAKLPSLCLRGLMAIPRAGKPETEQRQSFRAMGMLFEKLQTRHDSVDTLSMGMSDDLDSAIMEGSTMVRIGTALFGPRQKL